MKDAAQTTKVAKRTRRENAHDSRWRILSIRFPAPLSQRVRAVVDAINREQEGTRASNATVVIDVLAGGTTLEELERRYGIQFRKQAG